jgi:hypothetical protein
LLEDVTRDFIAFHLVFAPTDASEVQRIAYPGRAFWPPFFTFSPWYYSAEGVGAQHRVGLDNLNVEEVWVFFSLSARAGKVAFGVPKTSPTVFASCHLESHPKVTMQTLLRVLLGTAKGGSEEQPAFFTDVDAVRLLLGGECLRLAFHLGQPRNLADDIQVDVHENGGDISFASFGRGDMGEISELLMPDVLLAVMTGELVVAKLLRPRVETVPDDAFTRTWNAFIHHEIIPYDIEAREAKFEDAYRELSSFVAKWRALKTGGPEEIARRFRKQKRNGVLLKF